MTTTTEVISSANDLLASHNALISRVRQSQRSNRRQLHTLIDVPHELLQLSLISSPLPSPTSEDDSRPSTPLNFQTTTNTLPRMDLPPAKRARMARYKNYVPEEETIRNDYSQRYVDGGEWPQNWVLGAEPERRFEEYPKQQRLLALKKAAVASHSLAPYYLPYSSLPTISPTKFDSILIDPPFSASFTWDTLQALPIPSLAADPSFVFLWVGSGAGEGLERGREVLAKWGYRRCEDVVWVKTNKHSNAGPGSDPPTTSLFTRTKQHCLIGIRGTVRRSTDSWFVHCNVDTDVIIWEGDPADPTRKPPEMYTLIENFCLGTRRLEIFGRISSLRRGWVTVLSKGQYETLLEKLPKNADGSANTASAFEVVGPEGGSATQWNREVWDAAVKDLAQAAQATTIAPMGTGKYVVPLTADIETLRPKSPFRPGQQPQQQQQTPNLSPAIPATPGIPMGMGMVPPRFTPNARPQQQPQNQPMPIIQPNPMAMGGMGMGPMGMGLGMGMMPNALGVDGGMMFPNMMGNIPPGMGGMGGPMPGPLMPGMMFNPNPAAMFMDQSQFMPVDNFGMDPSQFMDQGQFMDPGWDPSTMMGGMNPGMNMGGPMGIQGMQGQWGGNFQ